ncbi:MAG: hypothetical protein ACI9G1_004886 [Pirellulaceae bacterium]
MEGDVELAWSDIWEVGIVIGSARNATKWETQEMKPCRHCFTEINDKASVCFECGNSQTLMGSMKGFILTIFPILTAIVSIGLAMAEKIEKQNVTAELKVETQRAEAATEAVGQLTNAISPAAIDETYEQAHGEKPSVERLERVRLDVEKLKKQPEIDHQQLINLQGQKIILESLKSRGQLNSKANLRSSMNNPSINRLPMPLR